VIAVGLTIVVLVDAPTAKTMGLKASVNAALAAIAVGFTIVVLVGVPTARMMVLRVSRNVAAQDPAQAVVLLPRQGIGIAVVVVAVKG